MPIDLLLKKACHRALVHLISLPETNPALFLPVQYYIAPATRHKTSIQHLLNTFKINPLKLETIPPKMESPTTTRQYRVTIADNKENAYSQETNDQARVKIYVDGSCHNGQVGAAAVEYINDNQEPQRIIKYRLGVQQHYTSNDAEIVGGILGCWMMKNSQYLGPDSTSLYTDSQSFINATQSRTPHTGHHLIQHINTQMANLINNNDIVHISQAFTLRWIPGHGKSLGNKRADEEAKNAAQGDISPNQELPPELRHRPLPQC